MLSKGRDTLFLVLLVAIGAALRLDFLFAGHFVIDADEAIVGLMAKHIIEGKGIPVFYYGQHYMGSFEPLLVSVVFKIFGISNAALKSVPFLFSLGLIPLVYSLFLEFGEKYTARVAALLIAVPPVALVEWSSKARGGFIEILVLGAYALLLTVRWLKNSKSNLSPLSVVAFILGFGWWVNNQIVYFIVPIGIAILWKSFSGGFKKFIQYLPVLALYFFLGGLPYWIYNFQNNFISLEMFKRAESHDLGAHLSGLFGQALPILLGAERFWHQTDLFQGSTTLTYILYSIILLTFIGSRCGSIWQFLTGKIDTRAPWEIIAIFVLGGCLLFAASSFGYLVQAPRYLLPLYIGIFGIAAYSLDWIRKQTKYLSSVLLFLILSLHLASCYLGGIAIPGEPFVFNGERVSKSHHALIDWLKLHNISYVRTNYWIGYRLAFETKEAVTFAMFEDPYQVRIPSYERPSENPHTIPLLLVPSQADIVRLALSVLNISFKEISVDGYILFYDLHEPEGTQESISPKEFKIACFPHEQDCQQAADGDINTRWGSAHPQSSDMFLAAKFDPPQIVKAVSYELGKWSTDYPRRLEIWGTDESGNSRLLLDHDTIGVMRYFVDRGPLVLKIPMTSWQEIIFKQLGHDSVFDWSMAEVHFYR